ncbi:MFS transporter [Amnibacterium sp. CER49]|uniref:MFS transporter n=1 Tax=Amnibacterium sp. CER49 TaxID=3039161 RepID=UPI00244CAFEA|nr:MFS transporter [Amnibacterium sp. CER49]MDH2445273.1 MFS transporter [Amnibacterium sp. CER49]
MTSPAPFRLGSVALPVYLPSLLFATGEGAVIPILPVSATRLGAPLALAGLIAGLLTVGQLIGDLPSGWIVARVGERRAMLGSAAAALVGLLLALVAPVPAVLALGVLIVGIATASFALARQAFMTSFVPLAYRARALSLLGGMFRAGYFVGPFLAAAVIALAGTTQAAFFLDAIACFASAVVLLALPDPAEALAARRRAAVAPRADRPQSDEVLAGGGARPREGLFATVWRHRGVLARMGTNAALIGGLRASRQVILPLVAVSLRMPESSIALVIGLAGLVDFALFFTSGQIMDRFGRLWSALPSMIGLGLGHLVLALTHDLPSAVAWFVAVAMFLSVANGLGSGILMTFGADLAPRHDPAPFLGAYRFTGDVGNAAAPLLISLLTAVSSVAVAAGAIGVLGLLGAGLAARWVPRYIGRRAV